MIIAVGEYFEWIEAIKFKFLPKQLALIGSLRATWLATEAPKIMPQRSTKRTG